MADAKPKAKEASSVDSLFASFQKEYGVGVGNYGGAYAEMERVPTGLFPLDHALGGGFPRGKLSEIFGVESSNKTNIALLAIANHQKLWPELKCVFIDLENSFDPLWAAALGVDVTRLLVIKPDYAEQAVDMMDALMSAKDIGLVVADSLAAFVTFNESESSAEKALVGGSALLVGKLMRKIVHGQTQAAKEQRYPTVICINQTRMKIGVMFGSPETTTGGNAPKFFASLRLRVYGKNVFDKKVSETMPVLKNVMATIVKHKMPIIRTAIEFDMATANYDHLKVGECDDWGDVSNHLKDLSLLGKSPDGKGYIMLGQTYKLLGDCRDKFEKDKEFAADVRKALIEKLLADSNNWLAAQKDDPKEVAPDV